MGLPEASRSLPGNPHPTTIYRWATRGVSGVRLESLRVGGRFYTSSEAIDRFLGRLDEAAGNHSTGAVTEGLNDG